MSQTAERIGGVLQIRSAKRYLIFATSILKLYTNLELNKEKPHEDYDLLREDNIMRDIVERIGEDLEEFKTIFNMTYDDMMYNENNWRTFISGQFSDTLKAVVEFIGEEEFKKQTAKLNNMFKM